jgi:hypothetical protein
LAVDSPVSVAALAGYNRQNRYSFTSHFTTLIRDRTLALRKKKKAKTKTATATGTAPGKKKVKRKKKKVRRATSAAPSVNGDESTANESTANESTANDQPAGAGRRRRATAKSMAASQRDTCSVSTTPARRC